MSKIEKCCGNCVYNSFDEIWDGENEYYFTTCDLNNNTSDDGINCDDFKADWDDIESEDNQ